MIDTLLPFALAVVGIVGTLLAGKTASKRELKNRSRERLRDLVNAVCVEALAHAQHLAKRAEKASDPLSPLIPSREEIDADLLTARVHLLGEQELIDVWDALIEAQERLEWEVEVNGPDEVAHGTAYWSKDNEYLRAVLNAADRFRGVARDSVQRTASVTQPKRLRLFGRTKNP